jgi:hypothetical protein
MAGYSVTFSVVDQATKQIDAITKRIQQMRAPMERQARSMQQLMDATGLKKVAEGFTSIARTGLDAFESLSRLVPAMGAITGAASIAGMVELVKSWAEWGVELKRSADSVNTSAQQLERLQDSVTLAGGSADEMTQSLKDLTAQSAAAVTGNTQAIAAYAKAGIALKDNNNQLRTAADLLPEVIKYIDSFSNAADRQKASIQLTGSAAAANLVETYRLAERNGESALDAYNRLNKAASQYTDVTNDQIAAAQRQKEAIGALDVTFSHLETTLGATASTVLTPLMTELNDFLRLHQPEIQQAAKDLGSQIHDMLVSDRDLLAKMKTDLLDPLLALLHDPGGALTRASKQAEKDQAAREATMPGWGDLFSGKVSPGEWAKRRLGLSPAAAPTPAAPANENLPLGKQGALGGANYAQRAAALTSQLAKDLNLTPAQAAGIVGNLGYESGGLNPAAHEKGQPADKGGVGFAQWTGPRRREFEAYSKAAGLDPKSDAANVAFLEHELKGKYAYVLAALKKQTTVAGSTSTVLSQYEAPADPSASADARLRLAQKALDAALPQVAQAQGAPAQVTGGPPVSGSVDVTITHKNPPPGSFVTASASGDASVSRPRTEQQQLSAA